MRRIIMLCTLVAAAALAPAAFADDNTSFETGDLSGWSVDTPTGDATVHPGGAPGGGNYFAGVTAGAEDQYQSISIEMTLSAGDAVSASTAFVDQEGYEGGDCFYNDYAEVVVLLDGNVVATIFSADACAPGSGVGPWTEGQVYVPQDGTYTIVVRVKNVGDGSVSSQVWLDKVAARVPRAAYCAAQGNTRPDGTAIVAGTFLELRPGQPAKDSHYSGATPAIFVEGKGLTCDPPPPGFVRDGLAGDAQHVASGLYPYFERA
jgi:hypothetical protein